MSEKLPLGEFLRWLPALRTQSPSIDRKAIAEAVMARAQQTVVQCDIEDYTPRKLTAAAPIPDAPDSTATPPPVENERLQREFLKSVAHELRTPMTVIRGYTDLLQQMELDDETRRDFLDEIARGVNRMAALVDELFNVSRAPVSEQRGQPVDMQSLLKEVLEQLAPAAAAREQQISVEMPNDLPLVSGQYDKILQVMNNLVRNAIAYTPNKGSILIHFIPTEQQSLRVQIEDDGYPLSTEPSLLSYSHSRTHTATPFAVELPIARD